MPDTNNIDALLGEMSEARLKDLSRVLGMGVAALTAAEKAGFAASAALMIEDDGAAITVAVEAAE